MAIKPRKPLNLCGICAAFAGSLTSPQRGPAIHNGREWTCARFRAKAPPQPADSRGGPQVKAG